MPEQGLFTVAVVGGGIVGVVLTLALRNRNINVDLYERDISLREVSASMGINGSAVEALKVCSPEAYEAFKEVMTPPVDANIAIEFRDGYHHPSKGGWTVPWDGHLGGVHRGQFLEALTKRLPQQVQHLGKRLESISEPEDDSDQADSRIKMTFSDGTTATADIVIGADGIGSHVRRYLFGEHHPAARARYAHQYVYRAVLPAKDAVEIIDKRYTQRGVQWMGKTGHVVTTPMGRGTLLGFTALIRDPAPWPSENKLVLPASKEDVVRHFKDWSPEMRALADAIDPTRVDRWGLFDLAETPLPYYARGRIALVGDAAHASTPHLGSGAMCGIEDAAILAEVLADERMQGSPAHLAAALAAYSTASVPRGAWTTQASRKTGDLVEYSDPVAGDDIEKIREMTMAYYDESWSKPVHENVRLAKEKLANSLAEQ